MEFNIMYKNIKNKKSFETQRFIMIQKYKSIYIIIC